MREQPGGGAPGIPLEKQLADARPTWKRIAARYGLVETDLNVLASAWHTDADLGRPIEGVTDMSKEPKVWFYWISTDR